MKKKKKKEENTIEEVFYLLSYFVTITLLLSVMYLNESKILMVKRIGYN